MKGENARMTFLAPKHTLTVYAFESTVLRSLTRFMPHKPELPAAKNRSYPLFARTNKKGHN
jgi:hypothetical protein